MIAKRDKIFFFRQCKTSKTYCGDDSSLTTSKSLNITFKNPFPLKKTPKNDQLLSGAGMVHEYTHRETEMKTIFYLVGLF